MKTYRVPVAVHLFSQVLHVDVDAESEADAVDLAVECINDGEHDYEIEKNVAIDWLDAWKDDVEILECDSEEDSNE